MPKLNSKRLTRSTRALIDKVEPVVKRGYLESVQSLRDGVSIQYLATLIEQGDVEAVLDALDIEDAAFAPLRASYRYAFEAGGNLTTSLLPKTVRRKTDG